MMFTPIYSLITSNPKLWFQNLCSISLNTSFIWVNPVIHNSMRNNAVDL